MVALMSRYLRVLGVRGSVKLQKHTVLVYVHMRRKDAPLNPPREQYLIRIEDLSPNLPHVRARVDSGCTDRRFNLLRARLLLKVGRVEALETQKHGLCCSEAKGYGLVGDGQ